MLGRTRSRAKAFADAERVLTDALASWKIEYGEQSVRLFHGPCRARGRLRCRVARRAERTCSRATHPSHVAAAANRNRRAWCEDGSRTSIASCDDPTRQVVFRATRDRTRRGREATVIEYARPRRRTCPNVHCTAYRPHTGCATDGSACRRTTNIPSGGNHASPDRG